MCDTIPALQEVEEALALVCDHASMPKVIHVAAHASLMLAEKSMMNVKFTVLPLVSFTIGTVVVTALCCQIAMCPNKKLKWFEEHRWEPDAIEEAQQLVVCCWAESYKMAMAAAKYC